MKTSDVISNTDIDENCGCQQGTEMNYKQPEMDHEVQMARSELYRAANSAIELHKMLRMINERQGIEGWVAAKITKAADYLESVYHYLDYEMRFSSDDLGEQATIGAPGTPTATSTPGMVKMAKVGPDGKPQGTPVIVAATQIAAKQKQGMKVIGESHNKKKESVHESLADLKKQKLEIEDKMDSIIKKGGKVLRTDPLRKKYEDIVAKIAAAKKNTNENTTSGAVATAIGGNGFKNGGPGTMTRAKKVKEAEDDEGWYTHHEIHGDKGISKEDWKKGWRLNSKGQRVQIKKEAKTGPKFTGYYKGTDKGKPGNKMVGSD